MAAEIVRQIATLPETATARTKHTMNGQLMPPARYVVLETNNEGTYIFCYSEDGKFSGDTWHLGDDDALSQIEYEFGSHDLSWRPISESEVTELTKRPVLLAQDVQTGATI